MEIACEVDLWGLKPYWDLAKRCSVAARIFDRIMTMHIFYKLFNKEIGVLLISCIIYITLLKNRNHSSLEQTYRRFFMHPPKIDKVKNLPPVVVI